MYGNGGARDSRDYGAMQSDYIDRSSEQSNRLSKQLHTTVFDHMPNQIHSGKHEHPPKSKDSENLSSTGTLETH